MSDPSIVEALRDARAAEREQTRFYRALAAEAEEVGDPALSERFQELHADEQHHLSRISARLLELATNDQTANGDARSGASVSADPPSLAAWEPAAREREAAEVARYESLLALPLDEVTRGLIDQILEVERHHLRDLGGKWTPA